MANMELGDLLYQRMAAEQQKFRDWLLTQPPNVILDHACEYTIREDMMVEMEDHQSGRVYQFDERRVSRYHPGRTFRCFEADTRSACEHGAGL